MRRQVEKNINTKEYYDNLFKEKECTKDRVLRQEVMLRHIGEGRTIELASGLSYLCQMIKKKYPDSDVWGLDFSVIATSRMAKEESSPEEWVNYIMGNALNTPFKDGYFDCVISGEFIEHVENPQDLINEMYRICKDGGTMVLSTPHLETSDPEHLWEFEPKDIIGFFNKVGCDCQYELFESDIFKGRYYIIAYAKK